MAVIINTANAVPSLFGTDGFGTGLNGFTSGNAAGGELPTELHSSWFNSVQQSINDTIVWCRGYPAPLNGSTTADLGRAVEDVARFTWRRDPTALNSTYRFRSQGASSLSGNGPDCHHARQTEYRYQLANSTSTNMCPMALAPLPNGSAMTTFRVTVCQSDSPSYGSAILNVATRTGGLGAVSTTHSDISLAGLTLTVVSVAGSVWLRVTIPAIPVGKVFNAMVFAEQVFVF